MNNDTKLRQALMIMNQFYNNGGVKKELEKRKRQTAGTQEYIQENHIEVFLKRQRTALSKKEEKDR